MAETDSEISKSAHKRLDKIDATLEKLASIQADLTKMLAVHEFRITDNKKTIDHLEAVVEKRKEELDIDIGKVYQDMKLEDSKILEEISQMRKEQTARYECLNEKITKIQKQLWMYMGGLSVIIFLITHIGKIIPLFTVLK